MQKCLVLCKTLDVFAVFYGQENGQMGKIVDIGHKNQGNIAG